MIKVGYIEACLVGCLVLAGLSGCGGDVEGDTCVPMESTQCFCATGGPGAQTCNEDGTSFGDCICGAGTGVAGSSATAGATGTAGLTGNTGTGTGTGTGGLSGGTDTGGTDTGGGDMSMFGGGGDMGGFSMADFQMFVDMCMQNPDGMFCDFLEMFTGMGGGDMMTDESDGGV